MADLQDLFSRFKSPVGNEANASSSQPGSSIWAQPQQSYQHPSVSSPLFSPPISTPNPTHPSAVMSPAVSTPAQDPKAANLLNLLRFNGSSAQPTPLSAMQNVGSSSRSVSASQQNVALGLLGSKPEQTPPGASPMGNPQDFLLNLLNQPKKPSSASASAAPLQAPQPQAPSASKPQLPQELFDASIGANPDPSDAEARASREPTPVRVFGSVESRETTPFEAPQRASKTSTMFNYVNPFEQLSASSPRNRTPKPESRAPSSAVNNKPDNAQPGLRPGETVVKSVEHNGKNQSVSEALNDVGDRVDKQVEKALANADGGKPAPKEAKRSQPLANKEPKVKKEPRDEEVADSWESAELDDSSGKENSSTVVHVYNFPMRPFVSITLVNNKLSPAIRPDALMDIARLKKDFDQIDRTLVTASTSHIVYAMSKNGGFRVIRQDSGKDKQVFRSSQERVFNVQVSTSAASGTDAVLATGINGSVFWTEIASNDSDQFDDADLEASGFVLPPLPVQDDNTSGSPVKTRSKMSSRTSEMIGIARGKSVYLLMPLAARSAQYVDKKTRVVDQTKYSKDYSMKIATGKACKDFAFSEDDSLVVSLDKAGKLKFWDIREMRDLSKNGKRANIEQKNPLLTLTAWMSSAEEKISPTSIMFIDKERPCVKGISLRYLLVGFKQNHVIQLWDLGLGKPVQELHLPHDNDSDAICSIAYHPKTGIVAIGHPTRNSIYFIHLSAPRYHIPNMDQARYLTMIATQDPSLPKPESTAIMSGIRELSFASKGQLRSIDMLNTPASTNDGSDDEAVFELYAMHSKGVTCVNIKKEDLGWGPDNRVKNPIDADKEGYVRIESMVERSESTTTESTVKPKTPITPSKQDDVKRVVSPQPPKAEKPTTNGTAPSESKQRDEQTKTLPIMTAEPLATPVVQPAKSAESDVTQGILKKDGTEKAAPANTQVNGGSASVPSNQMSDISSSLTKSFDALYRKIDDDKRVQDAAAMARQDAVLRLVSSTLTDNVEKSLDRIVGENIRTLVLPTITDTTSAIVDRQLSEALATHLNTAVPRELKAALPAAVTRALQDKDVQRVVSEHTASKLAPQIQQTFDAILRNTILPGFTNLAASTTQKAMADVEARFVGQVRKAEAQHREDNAKIEQLTNLVLGLTETVQEMAATQSAFQEHFLKMQQQNELGGSAGNCSALSTRSEIVQPVEDEELQEITSLMTDGRYEEGTIKWLQSSRQGELFGLLFVRCNPQYLQKMAPLVTLSVSAAITSTFEDHFTARLEWLGIILSHVDLNDADVRTVAARIMDVLQSRLQGAYMQLAELNPSDPLLRQVSGLSRRITEIKSLTS